MTQRLSRILPVFCLLLSAVARGGTGASDFPYLSPLPGSTMIPPGTSIVFRGQYAPDRPTLRESVSITATGSSSGLHSGSLLMADDGMTVIFRPSAPFAYRERVTVRIDCPTCAGTRGKNVCCNFSFTTGDTPVSASPLIRPEGVGAAPSAARERPLRPFATDTLPTDFPAISVTAHNAPPPLSLFLSDFPFDPLVHYTPYLMTLDENGAPSFIRRMPHDCFDFRQQPNGLVTYFDTGAGCFCLMDSAMAVIDTIRCGNGYPTDLHELRLLEDGHALLLGYDAERVRMDTVVQGGDTSAIVYGTILQELDRGKNVIFQWRSWDHFRITDAIGIDFTKHVVDYAHTNAIEVDADGNWVISSRHLSEITKIDRHTGDIIWRWGGKNNQFAFVNDTAGFSWQHHIRRLPDGHWTMFDNGNFHTPVPYSRAVEYTLDEQQMTATRVWQFRHTPDVFGEAMGSVQRFDDGSTLIGWGATNPSATLIDASGKTLLELSLPLGLFSYRAIALRTGIVAAAASPPVPATAGPVLDPAYPNPFNPSTVITFRTFRAGRVRLRVLDPLGRQIALLVDEWMVPGTHALRWDASRCASGVYFCILESGTVVRASKLVLLR